MCDELFVRALKVAWGIVAVSVAVFPNVPVSAVPVPGVIGRVGSMKYSAAAMVLVVPVADIVALTKGGTLAVLGVTETVEIVGRAVSFSNVMPVDQFGLQLPRASLP